MKLVASKIVNRKSKIVNGFTLIELLVVVAIIALLAAILFPVFARAREKSRQASCASNLKQLGLGILMYTQDFDESPPNGVSFSYDTADGGNSGSSQFGGEGWAGQLYPYVKSTQLFTCPSDFNKISGTETEMSYAYNHNIGTGVIASDCAAGSSPGCDLRSYPLAKYTATAQTVWLVEYRMPSGGSVLTSNIVNGESQASQYLSPMINGANSNCGGIGNGSQNTAYQFCGGGFDVGGYYPGWPVSDCSEWCPWVSIYAWNSPGNSTYYSDWRHVNGGNYLMADGHVKFLMPSQVSIGANATSANNNAVAGSTAAGTQGHLADGVNPPAVTFSVL